MRKALAIVGLLSLVAAAPSSQPAERPLIGWKGVVSLIPKKALPKGKTWERVQQEDAKAALDERLVGSTFQLRMLLENVSGKRETHYSLLSRYEKEKGFNCIARVTLAGGTDLHPFKEGTYVVVTGTVAEFHLQSGAAGMDGPLLSVHISDATIRKG